MLSIICNNHALGKIKPSHGFFLIFNGLPTKNKNLAAAPQAWPPHYLAKKTDPAGKIVSRQSSFLS
jgi:hypothetical protein